MTPATNFDFSPNLTPPRHHPRPVRRPLGHQGRKQRLHQRLTTAIRRLKRGRRIPSQRLPIRQQPPNLRHQNEK